MRRLLHVAVVFALLVGLAACSERVPAAADEMPAEPVPMSPAPTEITRAIFAQHGLDPDKELYLYEVIIPAGEQIPAHTHPGLQMAHIVEGTLEYEVLEGTAIMVTGAGTDQEGAETDVPAGTTVTFQTGDGVIEPEGMVHQARNPGDIPTRIILAAYFERGAELSSPVPIPSPSI